MAKKIRYENENERMNDIAIQPTEELIRLFMGDDAWRRLMRFEALLQERYDLNREIKSPAESGQGAAAINAQLATQDVLGYNRSSTRGKS